MLKFHSISVEELLNILNSNLNGLSNQEALKRLEATGKNIIPEEKISVFRIFLKNIKNVFNFVLFFALILTLVLNKYTDSLVIFFIIFFNTFIGFFFELRTEKTLQKLKELLKPKAKVIRNGELLEIESSDLVPGDIILVEEGDIVPADIRFFEVENLKVDESILTGESLPVEKNISVFPQETPIPEQKNIGFMGSYVVEGRGRGIVFATALNTYIGGIYKKFQKIQTTTPHFEKLSRDLILRMFLIALSSASIILFFSFQRDYFLADTLLFVLSAFISSIPEGLPIIISIVLVLSAYNLSKKNVLVRNLQATENLSIVNLLLSDKTGTLTENTMTVRKIFVNKEEIEITGEGLNLEGKFLVNNKEFNILENYPLIKILNICSIVSEAELLKDHILKFKGNARDIALLVMVEKSGINRETILNREKIIKREPFSRIKKYKKVIVEHEKVESYYIGAFESIINISKFILLQEGIFNFENKKYILEKALNYAQNGFSVLAVAFNIGESEENLIFVGLIALYDPPKRGVKETIQKLKKAGIETKILTGDHKETAIYIAKEIGFDNLTTLYQSEIENLDEEELKRKIAKTSIFARITPETKLKILDLYQKLGYSVAYIGDGVNDVLSLKKAEVGVCMGERGSEIAKQASDIILMDDHIESLSRSVSEGRKIFNNLRRVVFFLITTNVAESLTIITALILGYPFILKPTHILFLNFVTDTLVGTTLAFEREHGYELQSKPRKTNESLINLNLIPFLLMMSTIMTILTVMIFSTEFLYDLEKARTYAFLVMSFTQLYNAINLRSLNSNIFKLSFKFNPYIVFGLTFSLLLQYLVIFNPTLRGLLGFSKITLIEFLVVLILSSLVFFASEFYKFIRNRLKK